MGEGYEAAGPATAPLTSASRLRKLSSHSLVAPCSEPVMSCHGWHCFLGTLSSQQTIPCHIYFCLSCTCLHSPDCARHRPCCELATCLHRSQGYGGPTKSDFEMMVLAPAVHTHSMLQQRPGRTSSDGVMRRLRCCARCQKQEMLQWLHAVLEILCRRILYARACRPVKSRSKVVRPAAGVAKSQAPAGWTASHGAWYQKPAGRACR